MTELKTPTPKEKRILKAHKKRYIQDKDLSTIAQEMGYSYDTIRSYFREESTERIKQLYDEEEIEFLRLQLKNLAEDSVVESLDYIAEGKGVAESSTDYARLSKEKRQTVLDAIEMLQELHVFDKPKERKKVEQEGGGEPVTFNMRYTEENKDEDQEKAEVDVEE